MKLLKIHPRCGLPLCLWCRNPMNKIQTLVCSQQKQLQHISLSSHLHLVHGPPSNLSMCLVRYHLEDCTQLSPEKKFQVFNVNYKNVYTVRKFQSLHTKPRLIESYYVIAYNIGPNTALISNYFSTFMMKNQSKSRNTVLTVKHHLRSNLRNVCCGQCENLIPNVPHQHC